MVLYIKNPINPTKILLELKKKVAENKISIYKSVAFLCASNKTMTEKN